MAGEDESMRHSRGRWKARMLPLALVAVAGCGGGESDKASSLTHAQLVAKANAICGPANKQARALKKPATAGEAATYAGKVAQIATSLSDRLGRLSPPPQDRAKFQRYLGDLRAGARGARQLNAALKQGNGPLAQRLLTRLQANPDQADARALGLSVCAQQAGASG